MGKLSAYLDYAAATPIDERVASAMQPYFQKQFYNPSALYLPARRVKSDIEKARTSVAGVLGAKKNEIVFTAGATESINLAIRGIKYKANEEIVVSSIEHAAVLAAAKVTGAKVQICPVLKDGTVDLVALEKLINKKTRLVSIGYANNEIGVIQPISKIGRIIKAKNLNTIFHTDASQAPNYLNLAVNRLGVDLMSLNGGKIYGPKQSGCLYKKTNVVLNPQVHGGGQEYGLRSGTENVAGVIGFATALRIAQKTKASESTRVAQLKQDLVAKISKDISGLSLNGSSNNCLPNNLNISIKNISGEDLVHILDKDEIQVATGAACSANKDTPSHVLSAIGLSENEINSSLRISLGRSTTPQQIRYFVQKLTGAVKHLREA